LGEGPALIADLLLPHHDLNVARPGIDGLAGVLLALELALNAVPGPVGDFKEVQLAGEAAEDDAPRGADSGWRLRVGLQLANLLNRHPVVEAPAPRIDAEFGDLLQLLQPTEFISVCHDVAFLRGSSLGNPEILVARRELATSGEARHERGAE